MRYATYLWLLVILCCCISLLSTGVAKASPGCFNKQYEHMDYVPCDSPGAQQAFPGMTIPIKAGNTILPGRYVAPTLAGAVNAAACSGGLAAIGIATYTTGGVVWFAAPEAIEITSHVAEACYDVYLEFEGEGLS